MSKLTLKTRARGYLLNFLKLEYFLALKVLVINRLFDYFEKRTMVGLSWSE